MAGCTSFPDVLSLPGWDAARSLRVLRSPLGMKKMSCAPVVILWQATIHSTPCGAGCTAALGDPGSTFLRPKVACAQHTSDLSSCLLTRPDLAPMCFDLNLRLITESASSWQFGWSVCDELSRLAANIMSCFTGRTSYLWACQNNFGDSGQRKDVPFADGTSSSSSSLIPRSFPWQSRQSQCSALGVSALFITGRKQHIPLRCHWSGNPSWRLGSVWEFEHHLSALKPTGGELARLAGAQVGNVEMTPGIPEQKKPPASGMLYFGVIPFLIPCRDRSKKANWLGVRFDSHEIRRESSRQFACGRSSKTLPRSQLNGPSPERARRAGWAPGGAGGWACAKV